LASALTGGEWSASRPCRFTPGERAPGTHWIGGGWVDLRAGLDDVEKRKFLTLPRLGRPARSQSLYRLGYRGSHQFSQHSLFVCPSAHPVQSRQPISLSVAQSVGQLTVHQVLPVLSSHCCLSACYRAAGDNLTHAAHRPCCCVGVQFITPPTSSIEGVHIMIAATLVCSSVIASSLGEGGRK
jgi:hypothetical protein